MDQPHHPIKAVVRRTGLTAHVIRIWEKRYGAVEPARTGTNRRLYSDEQVERLSLLRNLTLTDHNIGHVAKLPTEMLRRLTREIQGTNGHDSPLLTAPPAALSFLDESIAAVRSLNSRALETTLQRAEVELGWQGLLQRVVVPLSQAIGDLWRDGTITAAHEHFATAIIRIFLGHAAKPFAGTENAPGLVIATPAGQIHELGALLVGAAAANLGWHVTYLGASLPAAEIAGAARQTCARAVAISLVFPEDDPRLADELTKLRDSLPTEISLLVGGRAIPAYRDALEKIEATVIRDLTHLCSTLDSLRRSAKNSQP